MNSDRVLDVSWGTILKIALAFLIFYLIFLVREILVWVVFALIISVLFNPGVNFLRKLKIPRVLAVIFIYVGIFGTLGFLVFLTAETFASEIKNFFQNFPQYFEEFAPPLRNLGIEAFESMETFRLASGDILQKASDNILNALAIIFGSIGSTILILSIAIFFSLEEKGVDRVIGLLSPKKHEAYILSLWERSQNKVSGWFGSRILISIFVGVAAFIVLEYIVGVEYSLTLAFLAGILDFIPILGPIIAGTLIFIFVAITSWPKAMFVLGAFILIQQIEGNIITPALTKKFVGLPPVLVLIALAIGAKLLGILGAILAIPLAGIIYEFTRDFLKKKKEEDPVIV